MRDNDKVVITYHIPLKEGSIQAEIEGDCLNPVDMIRGHCVQVNQGGHHICLNVHIDEMQTPWVDNQSDLLNQ